MFRAIALVNLIVGQLLVDLIFEVSEVVWTYSILEKKSFDRYRAGRERVVENQSLAHSICSTIAIRSNPW
jgi:hypothetical protein